MFVSANSFMLPILYNPLNTVDSPSVSSWLQVRLSMVYQVFHLHCASLHDGSDGGHVNDGSDGGHVNVHTPEVLIIFQHGIINSEFYWYWHYKLTITHGNVSAISIWHIKNNRGLFSAQTGSRGHLCLTSPKWGRYMKI